MDSSDLIILYHGTDVDSALDVLNHGISLEKLRILQIGSTQYGEGFYTTNNVEVAWFFASMAPGTLAKSYTVIECELLVEHLDDLLEQGLALRAPIANTAFVGEQIWFHPDAFEFVNENTKFRPLGKEGTS